MSVADPLARARAMLQTGQIQEAETLCRSVLASAPQEPEAQRLLGLAAYVRRDLPTAIDWLRQAAAPNTSALAWDNLSMVLYVAGQYPEAETAARQALAVQADYAEAESSLGNALLAQGRLAEAAEAYHRALALRPGFMQALNNLGVVLKRLGRLDEAIPYYRQAAAARPTPEAALNLGDALRAAGNAAEAVSAYRQALFLRPHYTSAQVHLGIALLTLGQYSAAADQFRAAVGTDPGLGPAWTNLGNALLAQGLQEDAAAAYTQALVIAPTSFGAHSSALYGEQYRATVTPERLARLHAEWDARHAAPLAASWQPSTRDRDPERPLRIGFVSADFSRHPVGYLLVRTLESLDRQQCTTICYASQNQRDDLTERLARAAGAWRDVAALSDAELAELIRADGIDLLIDMSGHTHGHRLLVFARKPAPLQFTWIGYPCSSGLGAIDYLIADHHQVPDQLLPYCRERVLRLPDSNLCFDPPAEAPPVSPLPALHNGYVTFGSFNNPAKVTPLVIATWAEVLRRVPRARLLLKYRGYDDPAVRDRFVAAFAAHGIAPDRLELVGNSPRPDVFASYRRLDLALDTFPYSGCTTTCEALWMGIPVVTRPGETFASRHALSIVSTVGLADLACADEASYVARAMALAADLPALAELRASLRERMARSPLCDSERFSADLLNAWRAIWRAWCRGESP